ncbi:hypothetical protein [Paraliomyxa miuraensis]|uniref:hypothetical protein n=1 Tax=Paraliomyxa miuraensis TaxID=376150 RepID=UPI002254DB8F|nr:hypothetical protein [Paraliomyxa miuraensis]MCX4240385.1 hypothetical protein [Paraliomyxa miuraensis]
MRHAIGLIGMALATLGLAGCPGDDATMDTGVITTTTDGTTTTTGPNVTTFDPTTGGPFTMPDDSSSTTSTGADETSSGGASESSSGGGPACEPPVVGEWNACIDDMGDIDNTLCNWLGNPDGTGFLTCITAPPATLDGGNFCSIRGCRDTCDCFDPPTTGTAPVICETILAGGETACGLDCSAGQTCPDGMECASGLCFWPSASG